MRPPNGHGYFKKTEYQKNTFLICLNIKSIIKWSFGSMTQTFAWQHPGKWCILEVQMSLYPADRCYHLLFPGKDGWFSWTDSTQRSFWVWNHQTKGKINMRNGARSHR